MLGMGDGHRLIVLLDYLITIVSQIKNLEGREIYRFQMRSPSGLSRFFI